MQLYRCSIGRRNPNPLCTRATFEALMRASTNHSLVAWTACLRLDLNTQSSAWEVCGSTTTPPDSRIKTCMIKFLPRKYEQYLTKIVPICVISSVVVWYSSCPEFYIQRVCNFFATFAGIRSLKIVIKIGEIIGHVISGESGLTWPRLPCLYAGGRQRAKEKVCQIVINCGTIGKINC